MRVVNPDGIAIAGAQVWPIMTTPWGPRSHRNFKAQEPFLSGHDGIVEIPNLLAESAALDIDGVGIVPQHFFPKQTIDRYLANPNQVYRPKGIRFGEIQELVVRQLAWVQLEFDQNSTDAFAFMDAKGKVIGYILKGPTLHTRRGRVNCPSASPIPIVGAISGTTQVAFYWKGEGLRRKPLNPKFGTDDLQTFSP